MQLKRLTVHGFKSFADKTHFDFQHSLTGIVGPNGCGKSNVVDALKWVLGDQRVRSLRGKEMTDVIFKGAEGREGSHKATVTVTLEDDDGERTETTIGRGLTKDKESEYLLNGDSVRLKDVRDVLMNTGLGVGAYSVMEQGRIDAVLSANAEDRRAIFEEAAGISRFKLQKKETLRKLDRTEINLARVKDLLEERARRIRSLKIQAGKARRYQEFRSRLRDLRAAVAVLEARSLRSARDEQQRQLEQLHDQIAKIEERCEALAAEQDELDTQIEARSEEHEQLLEQIRAGQSRREVAAHQAEGHDQRAQDQIANAEESRRRHAELLAQHAEKTAARATAGTRIESLTAELDKLAEEIASRQVAVEEARATVRARQEERETVRRRAVEWGNDRNRTHNAAQDMRAQLKAQDARRAGLDQRALELDQDLTGIESQVSELDYVLKRLRVQVDQVEREEIMSLDELAAADSEVADLARHESDLRQQKSSIAGRLQVLQDMETHMEGLDQGPRFLLESQPEGLRGRLIDLFETDVEFGAALEAALGQYVQALVVGTRAQADAMHRTLREQGKGRAILLIEEELVGRQTGQLPSVSVPAGTTSLLRYVRVDPSAARLADWLLRTTCVIDDLDAAPRHRHDLTFVTRGGGLLRGPRIEGGSEEGQSGMVVRKAQMQALGQESERVVKELDGLVAGKHEVEERVAAGKAETRQLATLLSELRSSVQTKETQVRDLLQRIAAGEGELVGLRRTVRELDDQRAAHRAGMTGLILRAFCMGRQEQRAAARETDLIAELETAQAHAQEVGEAEQELRLEVVQLRSDREAARDACRMHEATLRELSETVRVLAERETESKIAVEEHRAKAAESREVVEEAEAELAKLSEQRDHLAHALATTRQDFAARKAELRELEDQRGDLGDAQTEARLALGDIEHKFQRLEDRLADDVQIELRRCLGEVHGLGKTVDRIIGPMPGEDDPRPVTLCGPAIPPQMLADELALNRLWEDGEFDVPASVKEIEVLQAQIDRLGSVNLDAVEELTDEESGFVQTEQEVKDLTEARTSMVEALRRMEEESRTLFEATFTQAKANFQEIFRKLFQGGRADMFLTDDEDSLDGGIEIMARPPGKELQSINLLSGGERTLTALAILFAVFKVKPSPFCILDEVDAALDDTNVERFLRVLDDFVGPTQFCVVTHHKRTMAACNTLYGITMQRRGVSSRIAVNLEQVDELSATGLKGEAVEGKGARKQRIAGEEAVGF